MSRSVHERAALGIALRRASLVRLGLSDRLTYRPHQLSGGQQQRVSIARALINGAPVILADEPTGALDTQAGESLLALLFELNRDGHTVILVTHDAEIAKRAPRVIELQDGLIKFDSIGLDASRSGPSRLENRECSSSVGRFSKIFLKLYRVIEITKLAGRSLLQHRLRSALTMIGVVVGIASVVCMVAMGEGSQRQVAALISNLSPNAVVEVFSKPLDESSGAESKTLSEDDVEALRGLKFLQGVSPVLSTSGTVRSQDAINRCSIRGVGEDYFEIAGSQLIEGTTFRSLDIQLNSQSAVIDVATKNRLFPNQQAVGKIVILDDVPFRIIGVVQPKLASFNTGTSQLEIMIPYSSSMSRMSGRMDIQRISSRVAKGVSLTSAVHKTDEVLFARRGRRDFDVSGNDLAENLAAQAGNAISWFASAVAAISLLVGGIGVMNMMLVSVAERTREIGIRVAFGAAPADIKIQFLMESILTCLISGALGIALATAIIEALGHTSFSSNHYDLSISPVAAIIAFISTTFIGVLFGIIPAARAAKLDPIEALGRV